MSYNNALSLTSFLEVFESLGIIKNITDLNSSYRRMKNKTSHDHNNLCGLFQIGLHPQRSKSYSLVENIVTST